MGDVKYLKSLLIKANLIMILFFRLNRNDLCWWKNNLKWVTKRPRTKPLQKFREWLKEHDGNIYKIKQDRDVKNINSCTKLRGLKLAGSVKKGFRFMRNARRILLKRIE